MAVGDPLRGDMVIDGAFGEAYRDGIFIADMMEFSGTISIDRKDIPLSGVTRTQHKKGRVTSEGTLNLHKVDSRYLKEFLMKTSRSLTERRADRDAGIVTHGKFDLLLVLDDPEAAGAERLMLYGVEIWEMPIGFSIEELASMELPVTWDDEELIDEIVQADA